MENALESLDELDQSCIRQDAINAELEAFSYSVSHELRAPLRAIDEYIGILMEDYISSLDEEGRRLGAVIQANAVTMGMLIRALLKFALVGYCSLETAAIDMEAMVRSIYHEITTEEQRKRIKFTANVLLRVRANTEMLHQVWVNLLSNAVKFSGKQKQAVITVSCQGDSQKIIYCITDNGVGFNMEFKENLFTTFQRMPNAEEFSGIGLGLALTQRIIHRHNGEIWADGEVDHGAKFYFSIPNIIDHKR